MAQDTGSLTQTQTQLGPILHLSTDKTDTPKKKPRVRWQEGTVDNENMNKKKSKICCIFHPQQSFDELVQEDREHEHDCSCESESDSDSDSDSDSETDTGSSGKGRSHRKAQLPEPNSYEKQPKYKRRPVA